PLSLEVLSLCFCFFLMRTSPPSSTLFPYTTLFRSHDGHRGGAPGRDHGSDLLRSVECAAPRARGRAARGRRRTALPRRDDGAFRRRRLRPLHPLACERGQPLLARGVRERRSAPGSGWPLLPVVTALPAAAGGVRG